MSGVPGELLRRLEAGASPAVRPAATPPRPPLHAADFATLLERLRAGGLFSARPVSVASGVNLVLTPDQQRRLAVAVDLAHAHGMGRALVLLDGLGLRVDVGLREVAGVVDLDSTRAVGDIDGVVLAPGSTAPGETGSAVRLTGADNASLLQALSRSRDREEHR